MNRPTLQSVLLSPNPIKAKQTLTITIEAEDKEIVFGTALYYAAAYAEIYASEEVGIL